MNRLTYLVWFAVFVIVVTILLQFTDRPGPTEVLAALIVVPRLHDIGRSGWWYLVLIFAEAVALAIGWQSGVDGILIAGGIFVMIALAVLMILGFIPGEPRENRWGVPPDFGFHFRRDTREAEPEIEWQRNQ
jgi:uncharacterized membrane protein YhaH (DUF805 family)